MKNKSENQFSSPTYKTFAGIVEIIYFVALHTRETWGRSTASLIQPRFPKSPSTKSRASQKSNGKASISRWTKWISTHLIRAPGSLPSSDASWERRRPLRFRWPIWRKEMWLRLYQKNSTKKWKESSLICRMGDLQYLCKLKKKTKKKRPTRAPN